MAELVDAAQRGTLDVRTKALEHLVTGAALTVPGCVPAKRLPSATVTFRGSTALADLHVAATWPCAVEALTERVRAVVVTEASRLSGTDVARVDVTLHVVPADTVSTRARRRVQ